MAHITKSYCEGRKAPFKVAWRVNGQRLARFFETYDAREEFIKTYDFLEEYQFEALLKMTKSEISEVAQIKAAKGDDITFRDIWHFWVENHKTRELITTFDACNSYIFALKDAERPRSHIVRVRRILEMFCETFGDVFLDHISRKELVAWINKLPYSGQTKTNYKDIIRAAWSYFDDREWLSKNVAVKLPVERIVRGEIGILKVEEVEQLLRANENYDPEICGLMALGLFAGMRSSAITRVAYEEINFKERGIETPAGKTKKNRRQFIENLPDNLWAWLERTPPSAFTMCERKFKRRRELAYRRAGLLVSAENVKKGLADKVKFPPHNAFRHSFVSYHVALHRNFTDTALIISHRHTDILFEHYLGVAKHDDAVKYFNIYPSDYVKPETVNAQ